MINNKFVFFVEPIFYVNVNPKFHLIASFLNNEIESFGFKLDNFRYVIDKNEQLISVECLSSKNKQILDALDLHLKEYTRGFLDEMNDTNVSAQSLNN